MSDELIGNDEFTIGLIQNVTDKINSGQNLIEEKVGNCIKTLVCEVLSSLGKTDQTIKKTVNVLKKTMSKGIGKNELAIDKVIDPLRIMMIRGTSSIEGMLRDIGIYAGIIVAGQTLENWPKEKDGIKQSKWTGALMLDCTSLSRTLLPIQESLEYIAQSMTSLVMILKGQLPTSAIENVQNENVEYPENDNVVNNETKLDNPIDISQSESPQEVVTAANNVDSIGIFDDLYDYVWPTK